MATEAVTPQDARAFLEEVGVMTPDGKLSPKYGGAGKWCTYCCKADHSDAECWCTRAVGPEPIRGGMFTIPVADEHMRRVSMSALSLLPIEGKRYPPVSASVQWRPADEAFASARADERAKFVAELREIARGHKARGHAVKAAAVMAAARKIRGGK